MPALLSSTLTTLVLDVRASDVSFGSSRSTDPSTPVFLRSISGLPSLTSITIMSEQLGRRFHKLDLSGLPSLTQLQRLCIQTKCAVRCTRKQVAALVACRSLTQLEVGSWAPDSRADLYPEQLTNALGALVHGRQRNGATPLRKFTLSDASRRREVVVTPAVAQHLLSLTSLESLDCLQWSCDLTASHWSQLSLFTNLHTFHFATQPPRCYFPRGDDDDKAARDLGFHRAVTALQHCFALRTLSIAGRLAFRTAHATLLASLPSLSSLSLTGVLVESLEPLSRAPKLSHLKLDRCFGIEDTRSEPVCLRSLVPALSQLRSLTLLHDPAEPKSDSTAALFARLPLLTPAGFRASISRTGKLVISGWCPRPVNM